MSTSRGKDVQDVDADERYFLNPDSVSEHLYCSICQDVFVNPQRAPCGHSYCSNCIHQWLKNSKTCPEDRKPLQQRDLHFDFILQNIIGDQKVACPFRRSGCLFVAQLEKLSSHKKECSFNPQNLPDFLRKDSNGPSQAGPTVALHGTGDLDHDGLPSPAQPSLKMRLFQGADRNLLCSMFDKRDESPRRKRKKRTK